MTTTQGSETDYLEMLRAAMVRSASSVALETVSAVEQHFCNPEVGRLSDKLHDQLKHLLTATSRTNFDAQDLRALAGAFTLERAVGASHAAYDEIIATILPCFGGRTELKLPTDTCWVDAFTIGRGLLTLNVDRDADERHVAVAGAAARLVARGFALKLADGRVDRSSTVIVEIAAAVSERFRRLGLTDVLGQIFSAARHVAVYAFDQYLFGHQYSYGPRDPSVPFGFLLNLAVSTPDRALASDDPQTDWREAVEIARDLVAIIDVEPYNKFWMINPLPRRLEVMLNDVGLYDHLFGLRQWPIFVTPLLLRSIFGAAHDATLFARFGWSVADAIQLSAALIGAVRTDPTRITRSALMATGLSAQVLNHMLVRFAYPKGSVNAGYDSPLAAKYMDLMCRPLIEGEDDTFIAPAASAVGPACYEVVAAACRETLSKDTMSDLVGKGTERAVAALLRFRGIIPIFEGAKYNEGKPIDAGECDLVVEDSDNILLIECKAKPVTRATMGGEPGAALLDYAGGVIASQVQALQHQRLLHDDGVIVFDDGRKLQHGGRRITRLSVTLLDHGSLQDRFLFMNLVEPLLRSKVLIDAKDPKKKAFKDLNDDLDKHVREMKAAERRSKSVWEEALGVASLSVGQLATILVEDATVSELVERLRKPATYATMNPLLEYYHAKSLGLVGAS